MSTGALQRWLLVNYAGYPFAPNSLMPDNGLANLAGALLACGCQVEIRDYCTVSDFRRGMAPELVRPLAQAWDAIREARSGWRAAVARLPLLATLHRCERLRERRMAAALNQIGDELVADIRRRGIEAVGLKLWNGDGLEGSVRLARRIRADCPGVRIFGGGPQVDIFMEYLLRAHGVFDALVYGEGEETIQRLAQEGRNPGALAAVPNLIYGSAGALRTTPERIVPDLDQLPLPVYDPAIYPAMAGDEKIKIVVVDESRGCRNRCAFCIHPIKSHQQQRVKSIPRLMREVDRLQTAYGIRVFRFAGSCTPYRLLNEFAAEVAQSGRRLTYASFAHVRDSEQADFALLRRSGCAALFFGIESGSQAVLDLMRKGVRATRIPETIERANRAGIFTVGSFIVPAPGDTPATEEETLELLRRVRFGGVTIQPAVVVPRTDWFTASGEFGIAIPDRERYLREALRWKAKLLLPTAFWRSVPVTIDGRGYKSVLKRTAAFARRVRGLGVQTALSDDTYLMSVCARQDVAEFKERALRAFFTGAGATVAEIVTACNAAR
jgi:hypothetical protein